MTGRVLALIRENRKDVVRFVKFMVVGVVGAVVDFGTFNLLHPVLARHIVLTSTIPWDVVLANTISFTAAVLSNFTWNRYWTYPDSRTKPIRTQLVQFFVVNLIGWGINTGLLLLLRGPFVSLAGKVAQGLGFVSGADKVYTVGLNLAKAAATGVVLFWNFFVNRFWTYSDVA